MWCNKTKTIYVYTGQVPVKISRNFLGSKTLFLKVLSSAYYNTHSCIIRRPTLGLIWTENWSSRAQYTPTLLQCNKAIASKLRLHKSFTNYAARPRPPAITTDARLCRWEMCGRNHFCCHQKYCTCPQASAEDRYPVLPSSASAADAFMGASPCVCGCIRKRTHVCTAKCWRVCVRNASVWVHRRIHGKFLVCTSLLRCLRRFLLLSPVNGGREEERSWLSHRCLERQVGQYGSWNLTCVRCQHQATARKAYNRVSAISWPLLWTPVSYITSGKLAGWSVHVYNMHRLWERQLRWKFYVL